MKVKKYSGEKAQEKTREVDVIVGRLVRVIKRETEEEDVSVNSL